MINSCHADEKRKSKSWMEMTLRVCAEEKMKKTHDATRRECHHKIYGNGLWIKIFSAVFAKMILLTSR